MFFVSLEKRKRKRGQSDDYCQDISEPSRKSMRCLLKSDLPTNAINVTVPEVEKYKRKHSRNRAKRSPSTQLATHQGEEANVTAEMTSREAIIDGPSCSHDSATLLSQKPVNTEGMNRPALALNSLQSALNMCSKIKTEDFSGAVTAPSGVDAPETLSCISYYLRATYQLLFGADVQDVQESVGVTRQQQQFQVSLGSFYIVVYRGFDSTPTWTLR